MPKFSFLKLVFSNSLLCCLICYSCSPHPIPTQKQLIENNTIIVTRIESSEIIQHDTIVMANFFELSDFIQPSHSTVICVRHAETESIGTNPLLNEAGLERAELLKNILAEVALNHIYSTDLNRTRLTAENIASDKALSLEYYNANDIDGFTEEILLQDHSDAILVVGHSDSTPSLINNLIDKNIYPSIKGNEYDNLFLISIIAKGNATITHLRYGE